VETKSSTHLNLSKLSILITIYKISRHQTNHTIHSKPHLSFNSLNTKQPQDFLRNQTENKNKTNPKCTYHPNPTSTINSIKPHEFSTEKIQTQKPRSKNK